MNKIELLQRHCRYSDDFTPIPAKTLGEALNRCRNTIEYCVTTYGRDMSNYRNYVFKRLTEFYYDEIEMMKLKILEDHCEY